MQPTIGWIGLGAMGLPMARRLLADDCELFVWARRADSASALVEAGAQRADDPEALAQRCDVVFTIVGGPADVVALHRRMLPHARHGAAFVDMTTASPAAANELEALARTAGAAWLDCPVTGGAAGARNGTLTIFAGGDEATVERCRPLLSRLGSRIVPCGPAGGGYRMKLVNQTIMAGALLGIAQGAAFARACGLSAAHVGDALGAGTASGPLFQSYLGRMVEPGGPETFSLAMLRKDLTLARDDAAAHGATTRFLDFALQLVADACERFGERAGVQWLAADRIVSDASR
jgi:3-hydroxyisobutyrate dehydrogenase-like beta-hydroxyacid dehydrogenase